MRPFSAGQKRISLILKGIVIVSAALGTFLSAYAGRHSFMGGTTVFMYFTIQSNIALALLCAAGAWFLLKNKSVPPAWFVVKLVGTVSITLTGAVFCFVLAPTLGPFAWNFQNILTHVVVPLASIADFFTVIVNGEIPRKKVFWVILPPLLYVIYAGIGYIRGWEFAAGANYPYFFLNWGSPAGAFGFTKDLPFMGCAWWILALLLLLIGVAFLYLRAAEALRKRLWGKSP